MKRIGLAAALAGGTLLWLVPTGVRAEVDLTKDASDFSEKEYFDPPFGMRMKSHMTGAKAIPQPDGKTVLIKQMRLETFDTNGVAGYIVEAPECLYDQDKGVANSSGPMTVRQADGQVTLEGMGFSCQKDNQFLTISNQVRTTLLNKAGKTPIQ